MSDNGVAEAGQVTETSEAEIAVHWKEEAYIHPSPAFIAQANMTDPGIYERFSLDNFPDCFKEYADLLTWYKYWETNNTEAKRTSRNRSKRSCQQSRISPPNSNSEQLGWRDHGK